MVAVPPEFISTVFYLCVDKVGDDGVHRHTPAATGFFVRVPVEGTSDISVDYLVTARHCIEEARADGFDRVYVRFNKRAGGFAEIETRIDDWLASDKADVAAIRASQSDLPNGLTSEDVESISLNLALFVGPGPEYRFKGTAEGIGEVDIQPRVGHQIFFLGLFTEHAGSERNLPVARFGHIARMPDSIVIESESGKFATTAYLAEFHSIGGHSGSPVFFLYPMVLGTERKDEESGTKRIDYDQAHLPGFMGLIAGHFPISADTDTSDVEVRLNSGIAIVTPAEDVRELLMRDDFVEEREVVAKKNTPS